MDWVIPVKIMDDIYSRRYLLVLDDVWQERIPAEMIREYYHGRSTELKNEPNQFEKKSDWTKNVEANESITNPAKSELWSFGLDHYCNLRPLDLGDHMFENQMEIPENHFREVELWVQILQKTILGKWECCLFFCPLHCYSTAFTSINTVTLEDEAWLWSGLLSHFIHSKRFDIASCLLDKAPILAITEGPGGKSPVWALARTKGFPGRCSGGFIFRWIYNYTSRSDSATYHKIFSLGGAFQRTSGGEWRTVKNHLGSERVKWLRETWRTTKQWMVSELVKFLDIKNIYATKLVHVQTTGVLNQMCKVIESISDEKQMETAGVRRAMVEAAYRGNVEFVTSMAKANPELLWDNDMARNLFEAAIEYRDAKLFSLLFGLPDKVAIASYVDAKNNNLLHKAALLPHQTVLNQILGPALQMQRELQWFKEVEAIVSPAAKEWKNKEDLKPSAVFAKSHKDLLIKAEKWMKDTSSSLLVIAALIITVTFTAGFTSPGGYNQEIGLPMSSDTNPFRIFSISNAITVFASSTSSLVFLGILSSHYTEHDFLISVPTQLIIGLSTLFLSLAAMIIAFDTGIFIVFHHHQRTWILVPAICLVHIPAAVFVWLQFPLLVNTFTLTYGPSIFNRNVKRWM